MQLRVLWWSLLVALLQGCGGVPMASTPDLYSATGLPSSVAGTKAVEMPIVGPSETSARIGREAPGDSQEQPATSTTPQPATSIAETVHTTGEAVALGNGATLTIDSITVRSDGRLFIVATLDNSNGSHDYRVSHFSFSAVDESGRHGPSEIVAVVGDDTSSTPVPLNGVISMGERMQGYIAFRRLGERAMFRFVDTGQPSVGTLEWSLDP